MERESRYIQPNSPTDEERYNMIKIALDEAKHSEDFDNIIELLNPPKDIRTIGSQIECRGLKVGIIGGGLAGLAAAFELRKVGFDISIFEMDEKRIGGRIYTYYFDKYRNLYGEFGAMRIPVSHQTVWHYINLFKLNTRPFIQYNENTFIYVRNTRVRNDAQGKGVMEKIYPQFDLTEREKVTPWQKLLDYATMTPLLRLEPEIRKELLQIKKQYSVQIEYMDSLSIRKMLNKMGLSKGAIDLISNIVPMLGELYYNSYLENLIENYTIDYAYRYEIVDGMVNLPLAFYNSLISKKPREYCNIEEKDIGKVVFNTGTTVTGIYKGFERNKVILEYKNRKQKDAFKGEFDFVICANPFSSFCNINLNPMFSTEKMQAIRELNYTSSQKTLFMCSERFWEKGGPKERIVGGGSYTDLPITTIWYPGYKSLNKNKKYNAVSSPGVLLASYNLNQDSIRLGKVDNALKVNEIKRQLEEVHNLERGYLDSIVKDYKNVDWNNERGFNGGFCYLMPEQHRLFVYDAIKPEFDNRIYFAGEHTSLAHGWIQGALNSGMKAANDIVKYCCIL
ncbi:monoamine oxidase [Clostridium cavendishii DSM 21758]|uniref:Monoamine oxidase n=1 Tax=Clostridium cavendishii DSM 21758 TaxID=1121302 RepID=A0A1M6UGD4_9CLOT|nr:NAD(P)/FAD-dependent oxidoreductase [Clostridium cavendishii]SHK68128.1 monoamine oxidase [Clostridium cavendishii DSM 21758]